MTLFQGQNPQTQEELLAIRHRAMVARPMRTVERIKSRLAIRLIRGPNQETADALAILDRSWKQLYAAEKGRRVNG